MSSRAVCWLAESERQAVPVMEALRKSGFSGAEVSVITRKPIETVFPIAAPGAASGTLKRIGIPESEARRFEGEVQDGGVLISIQSDDPQVTDRAMAVFEHAGIRNFALSNQEAEEENKRIDSF